MTNLTISTLGTALIGFAAVVGATVAVCLGHIDTSTYIAVVGPLAGVGVGAGIHAAGVNTQPVNGTTTRTTP